MIVTPAEVLHGALHDQRGVAAREREHDIVRPLLQCAPDPRELVVFGARLRSAEDEPDRRDDPDRNHHLHDCSDNGRRAGFPPGDRDEMSRAAAAWMG